MKRLCTTEETVKALENRDSNALSNIEKSYGALLHRIAVNLGLSAGDTEECINDTLLEVWNTVPPAKPKSIRSYVCMLMRRTAVDRIRYNTAKRRGNTVYFDISNELDSCIDVENTVIDEMCIPMILNQFLEKQSPENREIFIRRYYEFENTRSIAADLRMGTNTIEKRLSRMRANLRKTLTEWGYEQ